MSLETSLKELEKQASPIGGLGMYLFTNPIFLDGFGVELAMRLFFICAYAVAVYAD